MARRSPEEVLAILGSVHSPPVDPRLDEVLEGFRRQWLAIGRQRYAGLDVDIEDAIQAALLTLLSPGRLDALREPGKLEAWGRSVFIRAVLRLARVERRRHRHRAWLGGPDEHPEDVLRERLPADAPGPEDEASGRERLRIVARCVEGLEVARLRFVDGLPEQEIARRCHLSRDAVAGQLKRLRRTLRRTLGEESTTHPPASGSLGSRTVPPRR
jgi:RNA polymerase sigma factor (sigma-70 family)